MSKACFLVTNLPLILRRFSATCFLHLQQNFFIELFILFFYKYFRTFSILSDKVKGPINPLLTEVKVFSGKLSSTGFFLIKFVQLFVKKIFFSSVVSASSDKSSIYLFFLNIEELVQETELRLLSFRAVDLTFLLLRRGNFLSSFLQLVSYSRLLLLFFLERVYSSKLLIFSYQCDQSICWLQNKVLLWSASTVSSIIVWREEYWFIGQYSSQFSSFLKGFYSFANISYLLENSNCVLSPFFV